MVATSDDTGHERPNGPGEPVAQRELLLRELEERVLQRIAERVAPGDRRASREPPEAQSLSGPRATRELAQLIQTAASLLFIAGAGLFAAIRFGQQVFYNRFGVRPEEVGLSYAASVSRAAVTIVALSTGAAFFYAVQVLRARLITQITRIHRFGRLASTVISFLITAAATIALLLLLKLVGDTPLEFAVQFIAYATAIVLFWSMTKEMLTDSPTLRRLVAAVQPSTRRLVATLSKPLGLLVFISLLSFGTLVLSGFTANAAANKVEAGEGVSPNSGFGILGLRAEPVLALGSLPENLDVSDRYVMYLGQYESTVVLYDIGSYETIRVPADSIAVSSGPSVEQRFTIRPEHGLDLDGVLEPYADVDVDGIVPARELDPEANELSWQEGRLVVGPRLDPTSPARAGILSRDSVPGRKACTEVETSLTQLPFQDIRPGLRICVHTTERQWTLLTVTGVRNVPQEIDFKATTWPA
jgi:hypothetical protein